MKITAFLIAVLVAFPAAANTYIKCGKTADLAAFEVTGYELELSSEGADDYSGPVGEKWNLKLKSESSQWLPPNQNVTAKNYQENGRTIVEITLKMARSVSGPVGLRYKLIGLYDETPTLEKFTMGGFAGTVKVATFQCLSGND
jgi:hypothetical protein